MESRFFVKTVYLLVVIGVCCSSSIVPTSLEARLCSAQFVFKFKVVSKARKVGCAGGILKTIAPLTNTYPTPTTPTTATSPTKNRTTAKTFNLNRILNNQPSTRVPGLQSTVSLPQSREKRCHQIKHQSILIRGDSVFKGKDKLKKINSVKELIMIKGIYYSYIRLDLNFETELPYEDFLFIGRQVGKIENQVFLSNPANVVSWNTKLEQKMKDFDFGKECKSRNNPSRPALSLEP